LAVVRPFVNHRKLDLSEIPVSKYQDGQSWIEDAQMLSRNALADIIKDRTEAYILDKAAAMGAAITVVVSVSGDEPPVPLGVEISGPVSPYMKLRLEEMIQEDLNIAKENQVWSG
jgi:stage III sporulation protein AF